MLERQEWIGDAHESIYVAEEQTGSDDEDSLWRPCAVLYTRVEIRQGRLFLPVAAQNHQPRDTGGRYSSYVLRFRRAAAILNLGPPEIMHLETIFSARERQ